MRGPQQRGRAEPEHQYRDRQEDGSEQKAEARQHRGNIPPGGLPPRPWAKGNAVTTGSVRSKVLFAVANQARFEDTASAFRGLLKNVIGTLNASQNTEI